MFRWVTANYEPDASDSTPQRARHAGCPLEEAYDRVLDDDGHADGC